MRFTFIIIFALTLLASPQFVWAVGISKESLSERCNANFQDRVKTLTKGTAGYQRLKDRYSTEKLLCGCLVDKIEEQTLEKSNEDDFQKLLSQSFIKNKAVCSSEIYKVNIVHSCFSGELSFEFDVNIDDYKSHADYKSCKCVSDKLESYSEEDIVNETKIAYKKYQKRLDNITNGKESGEGLDEIVSPFEQDLAKCEKQFGKTPLSK